MGEKIKIALVTADNPLDKKT